MANKRQRKKAAKKAAMKRQAHALTTFEGQQYTGGRVPNRRNLVRENGSIINQHNVAFTEDEKKRLERLVNRVNAKRTRQKAQWGQLPRHIAGVDTGQPMSTLQTMGKESDFIITRKTKSLQRFTSKAQFENYLSYLEHVGSKEYIEQKETIYKENYIAALQSQFGADADDIAEKVRNMSRDEFVQFVERDEILEIGYIYSKEAKAGKLNQIRAGWKMQQKPETEYE